MASISTILPSATMKPITAIGPSAHGDDDTGRSVHQGAESDAERPGGPCAGDGRSPVDHHAEAARPRAEVGSQDDVRIEQGDERVEVASRELPGRTRRPPRRCRARSGSGAGISAPLTRRRARLASCRAATGVRPTIERDLVERQLEHVVEHEGQPLGRREGVEHDEEREADRVGQQRLVLGLERPPG